MKTETFDDLIAKAANALFADLMNAPRRDLYDRPVEEQAWATSCHFDVQVSYLGTKLAHFPKHHHLLLLQLSNGRHQLACLRQHDLHVPIGLAIYHFQRLLKRQARLRRNQNPRAYCLADPIDMRPNFGRVWSLAFHAHNPSLATR